LKGLEVQGDKEFLKTVNTWKVMARNLFIGTGSFLLYCFQQTYYYSTKNFGVNVSMVLNIT